MYKNEPLCFIPEHSFACRSEPALRQPFTQLHIAEDGRL